VELAVEDEQVLEKYFLDRFSGRIMDEEAYHLLLLVMGLKPGVLVMSADNSQRKLLENFCKDSGLEMMVVEGEKRPLLDRLLSRDSRFRKDSIYLARKKERFSILKQSSGNFNGFSDEAVGRFLGYPDEALQFYSEEEIPGQTFQKFVERKMEEGEISEEDLGYLDLIGYLPKPEISGFREAVEEASKRERKLRELDEEMDCSIGDTYLQKIHS